MHASVWEIPLSEHQLPALQHRPRGAMVSALSAKAAGVFAMRRVSTRVFKTQDHPTWQRGGNGPADLIRLRPDKRRNIPLFVGGEAEGMVLQALVAHGCEHGTRSCISLEGSQVPVGSWKLFAAQPDLYVSIGVIFESSQIPWIVALVRPIGVSNVWLRHCPPEIKKLASSRLKTGRIKCTKCGGAGEIFLPASKGYWSYTGTSTSTNFSTDSDTANWVSSRDRAYVPGRPAGMYPCKDCSGAGSQTGFDELPAFAFAAAEYEPFAGFAMGSVSFWRSGKGTKKFQSQVDRFFSDGPDHLCHHVHEW